MKITKSNLTLHNIKRFIIAYKRKLQIWLFSRKVVTSLFKYSDSLTEYAEASNHIKEQLIWRLEMMKNNESGKQCIAKGECIHCGCGVPDLQLSDDACEGNCYPRMMNEQEWNTYKIENHFNVDTTRQIVYKYIV